MINSKTLAVQTPEKSSNTSLNCADRPLENSWINSSIKAIAKPTTGAKIVLKSSRVRYDLTAKNKNEPSIKYSTKCAHFRTKCSVKIKSRDMRDKKLFKSSRTEPLCCAEISASNIEFVNINATVSMLSTLHNTLKKTTL